MRPLFAVAAVVLLTGCGATPDGESASEPRRTPSSSPSQAPSSSPFTPAPADPDVATSRTCREVNAGIDAFNQGDYAETVRHFKTAVPLAEADADGSKATTELVSSVRYYAELAPKDYPEAARSSAAFAKNKAITLSQCAGGAPAQEEESESPGVEA